MGDQDVTLTSTTDTAEQVQAALGVQEDKTASAAAATEQKTEADAALSKTTADTDGDPRTKEAATTESDAAADDAAAQAAEAEKRKKVAQAGGEAKSRLDKRIQKLVEERNTERGEKVALQATVDALQKQVSQIIAGKAEAKADAAEAAGKTAATPPRPKAEDFADYDEYLTARDEWVMDRAKEASKVEVDAAVKEALKAREAEAAKTAQQAAQEEAQQRYQKSVTNAMARYEDFEEVVNKPTKLTRVMFDGMLDSEVGAEVAYYLSKNDDVRQKLFALGETARAIKEFGKVEALVEKELAAAPVTSTAATTDADVDDDTGQADTDTGEVEEEASAPKEKVAPVKAAPVKKATKAPDPMPKTAGGASAVSTVPADQLSFTEYKARRLRELKAQGRRL